MSKVERSNKSYQSKKFFGDTNSTNSSQLHKLQETFVWLILKEFYCSELLIMLLNSNHSALCRINLPRDRVWFLQSARTDGTGELVEYDKTLGPFCTNLSEYPPNPFAYYHVV